MSKHTFGSELLDALRILASYPLEEFAQESKKDSVVLFGANDWAVRIGDVRKARDVMAKATEISALTSTTETLRDKLAAKAMHGFISSGTSFGDWFPKEVAQLAYDQADAMLKAREAKT